MFSRRPPRIVAVFDLAQLMGIPYLPSQSVQEFDPAYFPLQGGDGPSHMGVHGGLQRRETGVFVSGLCQLRLFPCQ